MTPGPTLIYSWPACYSWMLEVKFQGLCVVIAQAEKIILFATALIKVEDNKIKRIDMCAAPSPHSAKRTGIYPS